MNFRAFLALISLCVPIHAGQIVTWGSNEAGQTNVPPNLTGVVAVAAGNWHTLALKSDGNVAAWGAQGESYDYGQGAVPPGISNVVAIACGYWHNVVLKSDGTVFCWGVNDLGQTDVPPGLSNVVAIAAGSAHTLALKSNGSVVAWGLNSDGQRVVPFTLRNVVSIAGGGAHSLALKVTGEVVPWGGGGGAQLPPGLSNVVAITAGQNYGVALMTNGTVTPWGFNIDGELNVPPGLTNIQAIAGRVAHTLALKRDGTIVGWGRNDVGQATPPIGLSKVTAIAAGFNHSVVVVDDNFQPTIVRQPRMSPIIQGQPILIGVGAVGPSELSFQWQRNGIDLPNETNSWLQFTSTTSVHRGPYTVRVSGSAPVTSAATTLQIINPQLVEQTISGGNVRLTFGNPDQSGHTAADATFYTVESTPAMGAGQSPTIWTPLPGVPQFSLGRFQITDPFLPTANRFYRVVGRL